MEENKNNIFYRPDFGPEKSYKSDGVFLPPIEELDIDPPEDYLDNPPSKIIEDLEQVVELTNIMPKDIKPIKDISEKIIRRLKILFPDGETPQETPREKIIPKKDIDNNIETSTTYSSTSDNNNTISLFPSPSKVVIEYESPRSIVQLINDTYLKDNIRLAEHYAQQIQIVMQKYFEKMLYNISELGVDDINVLTMDFNSKYVKIPSGKNLEHCRDYIHRSQAFRKQTTRLFRKTHSASGTLMHLRAWHASQQQRDRYFNEEYGNSSTYIDSHNNALLRESRRTYNNQYKQTLNNMYRYLNSSVKITDDILTAVAKEADAKARLLMAGVDIFATEELIDFQAAEDEIQGSVHEISNSGQLYSTSNANNNPITVTGGSSSSGTNTSLSMNISTNHQGLKQGFEAMKGKSYTPDSKNGQVWAVTNIGKYYSDFLKTEANRNITDVDTLINNAKAKGVEVLPFNSSNVSAGDIIVQHNNVVIATGIGNGYVGNSSSRRMVTYGSDYNFKKPLYIIKTSKR